MSFNKLPLEVIEEIFQYLGIEDMMNAWKAVGLDGSESYWGKVCRREGYNKVDGVDDTWRSVVNRNLNWRFRRFVRREYLVDENSHYPWHSEAIMSYYKLHSEHILKKDPKVPKLGVFNISNKPNLVQTMQDVEGFEICGSKLLVYNNSLFRIYTLTQGQYYEIFRSEHETFTLLVISNEFFAFVDSASGNIRIVDFLKLEEFNWILPHDREITSLSICGTVLSIGYITRDEDNYYVGRYNLKERAPINNVLLYERLVCSVSDLDFAVSPHLVVYQVDDYNSTHLFVRKEDGQLVNTLENCYLTALDGEHVIYTNTRDVFLYIWTSKNPNGDPKKLLLERDRSYYRKRYTTCIFGSLLILSRIDCFTVIDIHSATCLYEVDYERNYLNLYRHFSNVCVNEYFYVLYQVIKEENQEVCDTSDSSISGASPISKCKNTIQESNKSSDTKSDKVILVVYDFR